MIVIKTKNDAIIIDECNVIDVEYDKNRKTVWVRRYNPDGKIESSHVEKVVAVQYIPNTEQFTITAEDGTEE